MYSKKYFHLTLKNNLTSITTLIIPPTKNIFFSFLQKAKITRVLVFYSSVIIILQKANI